MTSYQAARERVIEPTVLRHAASPGVVASALALVFLVGLLPPTVPAASVTTYDFSGTLAKSGMVTGQFTVDAANISITSFHFTTPHGDITMATSTANVYIYTPASSPAKDFVEIEILPSVTDAGLNLNFEADLTNLTPSSFYPGSFDPSPNVMSDPSQLMPPEGCSSCEGFTAGTVTATVSKAGATPSKPNGSSQRKANPVRKKNGDRPRVGKRAGEAL